MAASTAACELVGASSPAGLVGTDALRSFTYLAEIADALIAFAQTENPQVLTLEGMAMEHRLSLRGQHISILSLPRAVAGQEHAIARERLRLAVEVASLAVWDRNLETDELLWSPEMYRLTGAPPADFKPTVEFWRSRIHPADVERVVAASECSIDERCSHTIEFRVLADSGRFRWIQSHWKVLCNPFGKPVRMIGVNVDITERREMEVRLSEVNSQLSAIISSSPAPIVALSRDGLVTLWNPAAEQLFGWKEEEVLGKILPFIPPEKRSEHLALRQRDLSGRSLHAEHLRRVRKDGHPIDISVSTAAVRDANGNITGIMSLYEDITSRLRAERALRESEERFRTLTEAMPQLVWTTTPQGLCDYLSSQWVAYTGVPAEDHYGHGWLDALHPADRDFAMRAFRDAVEGRGKYDIEYRLRRSDGVYRWFKTRGLPIRKEEGKVLKWLGTCTDIEEQKRTMEALVRANADLQQFAYAAAHDLQEPIRGIALYSQLLRRRCSEILPSEGLTCLTYLLSSAERIKSLVEDLLVYTQVSERDYLPADNVDCSKVLVSVRRNLDGAFAETSCELICGDLPEILGHGTRLVQVFQNLIGNAIKYRRADVPPCIHVGATKENDEWLFRVEDNGIGIASEYQDQIFGMFRRLHSREIPGTGIGLAICKRIVEGYGGRIWVTSAGEGRGSTFWFTLPAVRR